MNEEIAGVLAQYKETSLLSYHELVHLVEDGVITGVSHEYINASSIDVTLGNIFYLESLEGAYRRCVSLKNKERIRMEKRVEDSVLLKPGDFALAQTEQVFNLPDILSARFSLNSSIARNGLLHSDADWLDAGFSASILTLELYNQTRFHTLELEKGLRIGKVVFFRHKVVPEQASYKNKGKYNAQRETLEAI
jgi:deoxycytidine triphosphate deaminase